MTPCMTSTADTMLLTVFSAKHTLTHNVMLFMCRQLDATTERETKKYDRHANRVAWYQRQVTVHWRRQSTSPTWRMCKPSVLQWHRRQNQLAPATASTLNEHKMVTRDSGRAHLDFSLSVIYASSECMSGFGEEASLQARVTSTNN